MSLESKNQKESPLLVTFEKEEEDRAKADMWKYIFGFTEMAVLKCAVELGIPDALESHGRVMSLQDLSSTLNCDSKILYRVMRFLANRGIFKQINSTHYAQTALSRWFTRNREDSMAPLLLMQSNPAMLAPWHAFAVCMQQQQPWTATNGAAPFETVHGQDLWKYAAANPGQARLVDEAMACSARATVGAIVEECLEEVFEGVESVVDVGGGNGAAMRALVKACPRIRAVNFDLPHVVSAAEESEGVENVGGDMFQCVPKADATFLKWVLHDWSDDECIQILKNCREAIPKDKGKVIILEAVIETETHRNKEDNSDNNNINKSNKDKLKDVGLFLDMVMIAHTTQGKERTLDEWTFLLREAGFNEPTVIYISSVQSVIVAFPA